jgi:hypothetical protein
MMLPSTLSYQMKATNCESTVPIPTRGTSVTKPTSSQTSCRRYVSIAPSEARLAAVVDVSSAHCCVQASLRDFEIVPREGANLYSNASAAAKGIPQGKRQLGS